MPSWLPGERDDDASASQILQQNRTRWVRRVRRLGFADSTDLAQDSPKLASYRRPHRHRVEIFREQRHRVALHADAACEIGSLSARGAAKLRGPPSLWRGEATTALEAFALGSGFRHGITSD